MADAPKHSSNELAEIRTELGDERTEMAKERSREAAERTLLAWIRTAMSMIGFGLGFGTASNVLDTGPDTPVRVHDLAFVGSAFIVLAVIALFAAIAQSRRITKRLSDEKFTYEPPLPLGTVTAVLMLVAAFLGLLWINFR